MTLQLREVSKRYASAGETIQAVDRVSLDVAPGEFVALYGPSGSGKTTLLLLAAAITQPDEGTVLLDGQEVSSLSSRDSARYRREQAGMIFQSFHLINGASAIDNAGLKLFALGKSLGEAADAAQPWLERVGLAARVEHAPGEMSMGERQRVAIARALASNPRVLLADEPTGNLDSKRSREILGMLAEIVRERQIPAVLATHDPQATAFVDKVYTMNDGRLTEGLDVQLQPVIRQ